MATGSAPRAPFLALETCEVKSRVGNRIVRLCLALRCPGEGTHHSRVQVRLALT
jgi:hypothetical protein